MGLSRRRLAVGLVAMGVVFALGLLSSRAAFAKDGDVIKRVGCSGGSTAKLKLSDEDGRIEVEFEVDQNRNGVPWRVRITRPGGGVVFAGRRITRPPSGSFEVRRVTRNALGADTIRARATSPTGEICRVAASFTGAETSSDGDGTSTGVSSGESTSGESTSGGTTSGGSGSDDNGSGGHGSDD
jgi:hypothetical protein